MDERSPYLVTADEHPDARGMCRVLDKLPFHAVRMFAFTDVPAGQTRGGHAHKTCWQCLYCTVGTCVIETTPVHGVSGEGDAGCLFPVKPGDAVVLPPRNRVSISEFSPGAVLIVAASEQYDPDEFIREGE